MNKTQIKSWLQQRVLVLRVVVAAIVLIVASAVSGFDLTQVSAAGQLTSRSVTISSSATSAASQTYTYGFSIATAGQVQGIKFMACTTPLNTCTAPTGMTIDAGTEASRSGWSGATTFTRDATGANDCAPAANILCIKRTDTTSESGAKTLGWNTQTNPSSNQTVYFRLTTYTTNTWTAGSIVDTGTVAAAYVNQLVISAAVQENLVFCVGTTDAASANDCTDISGSTVNLGIVDSTAVSVSPVAVSPNGGNNVNGLAMIRTNGFNGTVVQFYSEQNTSSGALKVAGAACSGSSTTDQCFNSAPSTMSNGTGSAVVAGTEKFGMTVSSIDTSNGSTTNLNRVANWNGDGASGGSCTTASPPSSSTNCWAWNDTTTPVTIASSTASSVKVLDDEMIVMRFAATAASTTPTGSYAVTTTYIATPTF